jgi:hypothetical protein
MNRPNTKVLSSLQEALSGVSGPITVADASSKSGLSLQTAKEGLTFLTAEYRGTLLATADGELLYQFPTGFSKPWEQREKLEEFLRKIKRAGLGVLKFLVRAWITVVMLGYVVIFALIIMALMFSKSSDREENHSLSSSLMFHTLLRLILDSLFWTFHPFSPFYVGRDPYYEQLPRQKKKPFYERVNRFFFGPEEKPIDEQELVKLVLQEIRAQKGRIGLLDLMRVTGLSKEEADPFIAKLMVNYEGDVFVSEDGGIIYEFSSIRKTALRENVLPVEPIWKKREVVPPFTGNDAGSNFLIASLNGFNLVMSGIAISNGWTIEKLQYIFHVASSRLPSELLPPPPQGTPLLLGWIPLTFSAALFLIPVLRALFRGNKKREIEAKNGKRGLLRAILSKLGIGGIKEETLRQGWTDQAKVEPDTREFTREIIRLGGELELNNHDVPVYRFRAIEAEMNALEVARRRASHTEAAVSNVIFSSAK